MDFEDRGSFLAWTEVMSSDFSEGLSADRGVMLLPIRQACDENKDSAGSMIE